MEKPKVILLNGFAGTGKSTIANMYADEHPGTRVIEKDALVVKIPNWRENEPQAWSTVFATMKLLVKDYLATGHDVVLPYLVIKLRKSLKAAGTQATHSWPIALS